MTHLPLKVMPKLLRPLLPLPPGLLSQERFDLRFLLADAFLECRRPPVTPSYSSQKSDTYHCPYRLPRCSHHPFTLHVDSVLPVLPAASGSPRPGRAEIF